MNCLARFCIVAQICASSFGIAIAGESKDKKSGEREVSQEVEREYLRIIRRERSNSNRTRALEGLIAGVAATVIGTYGIYNDDRGIVSRVIYSATQTAGIISASRYYLIMNTPVAILELDEILKEQPALSLDNFKDLMVTVDRKRRISESTAVGYASLILAGIHGYNGYNEKNVGLRNVYYFMSLSFALTSGFSIYNSFRLENLEFAGLGLGFSRSHLLCSLEMNF
jgi:hypothetical protein